MVLVWERVCSSGCGSSLNFPLNCRGMIAWLFTHSIARGHLSSMITDIDAAIKKRAITRQHKHRVKSKTRGQHDKEEEKGDDIHVWRVQVGVTCSHGTQLSPCFVEKLFEHYDTCTRWDNLVVKCYHWDALRGVWGQNKNFVWQQKTMPVRLKEDPQEVAFDDMWTAFPRSINSALESAFMQNPYCHQFQYKDYSFNFEAGTVFNQTRKNLYPFRCNEAVSDSQVVC